MVSKKHKSKRTTLAKKYKIVRKVNEHNRKLRHAAKNKGGIQGLRKSKKDPGIPNDFPFKDQVLREIEMERENRLKREEMEKKRKREEAVKKQKEHQKVMQERKMREMLFKAGERGVLFESAEEKAAKIAAKNGRSDDIAANDNSRRAFYRELRKIVDNADVLLQVLDARDPLGCRSEDVERLFMASGPNKRIVLVLNKIDLVPKEAVEQWLKYLRNFYPTIAFKASTQSQRHNLGHAAKSASTNPAATSECVGADSLIQLLKNYARNKNIATSITVGVVGYPNVGKSSLINSLKRSKVADVGATPGVTKTAQTVHLDKSVKMLDCPGIVFAKDQTDVEVVLRNCVKFEQIEDPLAPVAEICRRVPQEKLMILYTLPAFKNHNDFLTQLATQRGKLRKGGLPDIPKVARMVLQDWAAGKIAYHTLPPAAVAGVHVDAQVVSGWGKEFDIEALEASQLAAVKQATAGVSSDDSVVLPASGVSGTSADMSYLSGGVAAPSAMDEADDEEEEDDDEDDDDEEEESGDEMEDDEEEEEEVAPAKKSRTAATASSGKKQQELFTPEEAALNPRKNRDLKQTQKKRSKKGSDAVGMLDEDSDSDYDFQQAFGVSGGGFAALNEEGDAADEGMSEDDEQPQQQASKKKATNNSNGKKANGKQQQQKAATPTKNNNSSPGAKKTKAVAGSAKLSPAQQKKAAAAAAEKKKKNAGGSGKEGFRFRAAPVDDL